MEQRRHRDIEAQLERLAHELKPGALMPALHELSKELLRSGYPREALYEDLKHLATRLRASGCEEELEDDVLEVMDVLVGWCAPSARL